MDLKDKIRPEDTAIIVIDIQNDFASPDKKFFRASRNGDLSMVDPMIDKLEKIIPIAEKAGVLVIYTQQIYDRTKFNILQKEQYDLDGKLVTCDISSDGYKFYRINPPTNRVFPKYNFNIFSNRDLINLLKYHKIKTLVLAGMDIIYCVETAIRVGFDMGYKIVVSEDIVAGNAKYKDLNNKTFEIVRKTYGVLTNSEELRNIWNEYLQLI
jgi:nicotinamidase-related amidase